MEFISKVDIYFNLHKKLFSVKDRDTGKVAKHSRVIVFTFPVELVVSEAGRQRVIESGHKNVHAFVRDTAPLILPAEKADYWRTLARRVDSVKVSYNPRKGSTFFRCDTGARINQAAALVMLAEKGKPPELWALIPTWFDPDACPTCGQKRPE